MKDKLYLPKTKLSGFINFCLGIAGRAQLKALNKASKNCAKSEEKTLRSILEYAKDTEWGKAHNFAEILEAKDAQTLYERWQKNVPPQDYEDLRPYIERCKNGEKDILYPGKAMMFATTSGTTSKPKWIPITNEYYNNVYSKMTKLWLYTFMMHRPKVFQGRNFSVVGKAIEGAAPDGTVCGSVSGVTRRDCPGFMNNLHSAPFPVFSIDDYHSRFNTLVRIGLEQNIGSMVTANPSTVAEIKKNIIANYDSYCDQIEKGTLDPSYKMDDDVRKAIEATLKPNPRRAKDLRMLKAKYGTPLPKHFWPNMQLLTTWKCGNTRAYMTSFKEDFPENMLHQEFSYFASECRAGLVMNGGDDTVPMSHMHYFEFIDENEIGSDNPKFLQLSELEVGKSYSIFVTTMAGLYRYNMNDLIKVTGKYKSVPMFQFIQKINGIVSMTGEKISERQFIDAVKSVESETGIKTPFYLAFADLGISTYQMYFEFEDQNLSSDTVQNFGKKVDDKLRQLNCEYESKVTTERVKPAIIHELKKDSLDMFKKIAIEKGLSREGQFKFNSIMQNEQRHEIIKTLVK